MSKSNILALVEALREAGQREHGIVCDYGEATICPADGFIPGPCECGADKHNAAVDEAAKALRSEIESGERYEKTHCKKCGTPLRPNGKCKDVTCPYSDRQQNETYTEG